VAFFGDTRTKRNGVGGSRYTGLHLYAQGSLDYSYTQAPEHQIAVGESSAGMAYEIRSHHSNQIHFADIIHGFTYCHPRDCQQLQAM
jgi:hypothetical protein